MKIFARACVAVALVALCGCGAHGNRSAGGATTSTTGDTKMAAVTTANGTESIANHVDPAKLGVPIYAGAVVVPDSQIATSTRNGTGAVATFETADPFVLVEAFYKSHLPAGAEKVDMVLRDDSMAEFQVGDQMSKKMTIVTVRNQNGKTDILISNTTQR